ncbi:SRPBCC domain-containing protein [Pseudolysinimonas sp.]|jgi:uncharacterized protein YndB with AHSA1/START domain|uniref:SRPBCC domain-containing protein n=1 Tax=Pseudolysinimonas sp. TaxID=2680009 RepID=UPI003784CF9E
MTDRTVTISRRFAAAPDKVWAAWTTESGLRSWYAPLEGWIVGNASVDARLGGGYDVTFGPEPEGDLYREEGTYNVFTPIEKLAWDGRLTGEGASEQSSISITFTPDGDGTVLDITESGLSEESVDDHEMGWNGALDRLEELFAA